MTFNIPVETELVSTSVTDPTPRFINTQAQVIYKDMLLQSGTSIWQNATGNDIKIIPYDSAKTYEVGDVAFKDGVIKRLASKGETLVLKEPWEYDAKSVGKNLIPLGNNTRYFCYADTNGVTLKLVDNPATKKLSGSCVLGWDDRTDIHVTVVYDYENDSVSSTLSWTNQNRARTSNSTLRYYATTSEGGGISSYYVIIYSSMYEIAASTDCYLSPTNELWFLINRNVPYEYKTITTDNWVEVTDPKDLGMSYYGITREIYPFDAKQYTSVIERESQSWVVRPKAKFDTIALGRLRGETLSVSFKDPLGVEVLGVTKAIPSTIDEALEDEAVSQILYAPQVMNAGSTIEILITSPEDEDTEVGFIFAAISLDVGATDLAFSHDIKNFDRDVVSEISGYIDHIRGNRVIQHRGSFHIPMSSYDKMLLLNKKITQELIAIDGSDMRENQDADGESMFNSTKIIGRVKQLSMSSKVKDGDLTKMVPIAFEFEEVV